MDDLFYYNDPLESQQSSKDVSTLSETQDKLLFIVPIISATLSICGSSHIIYMVLSCDKRSTYRRILLGMSCCDVFSSITFALQPFLVPSDTSQRIWAIGNEVSCNVMGFSFQFSFSNYWYNAMLSFYFLLTVKFGITEFDLARCYELPMHILSVGFPLITAIIGAFMGVYHELSVGHGCWITNYPEGCDDDNANGVGECLSPLIAWIFAGIPVFLCFCSVLVNNLLVYCHVRYTIKKSREYAKSFQQNTNLQQSSKHNEASPDGDEDDNDDDGEDEDDSSIDSNQSFRSRASATFSNASASLASIASITASIASKLSPLQYQDTQAKRVQAVAFQAFLYVTAFLITQTPGVLVRVLDSQDALFARDEARFFPLLLLLMICYPLQGFLNCFIYVRPAFVRARKDFPDECRFWAFRRAMYGASVEPSR